MRAAIGARTSVTVAPITRTIRDIPSEVHLDRYHGEPGGSVDPLPRERPGSPVGAAPLHAEGGARRDGRVDLSRRRIAPGRGGLRARIAGLVLHVHARLGRDLSGGGLGSV
jgi:hypothetical protein